MDREETSSAPRGQAPVTFVDVAALFGRLVGLALALGLALGLLLTAAAVALPAPAAQQEIGPDRATRPPEGRQHRRPVQLRTDGSGTDQILRDAGRRTSLRCRPGGR